MNNPEHILDSPQGGQAPADTAPLSAPSSLSHRTAIRVLESITDAFATFDREWHFTFVNSHAERMLARAREELLGQSVWDVFPETVGTISDHEYHRAVAEQTTVSFEQFYPPLRAWFDVRAYPSPDGLSVFFQDITARKLAEREREGREQRERFLAELAERARALTDPDALIGDAVQSVGEFLGVARCVFVDIDIEADICTALPDYRADDTVISIAGVFPISAFGPFVVAEYRAGRAVTVNDVRTDSVRVPPDYLMAYEEIGVGAYMTAPVMHSARLVSAIAVHSTTPRCWKPEELALLQNVVERTWLTVEVLRQERALMREAEAMAHVLESITEAFFSLDKDWRFVLINDRADQLMTKKRTQVLGQNFWEAYPGLLGTTFEREYRRAMAEGVAVTFEEFYRPLDAWLEVRAYPSEGGLSVFYQNVTERKRSEEALRESEERYRLLVESTGGGVYGMDAEGCFTFVNQAAAQMLRFTPERLIGQNVHALIHHTRPDGTAYPEDECPISHALRSGENAHAEDDVFWRVDGAALPVSYRAAPIFEQGRVRGAVVTFSDIGERKALDEERERLAQRERNIARQLQAALTPSIPDHVPGLALAKYYEAALDEAGVGGDFYDVFPVAPGCTALVIGDLAGKGLAAASQVATVRNMLRYALYRARTLAGALESLNVVLAEQRLLAGFATLFVGTYDNTKYTLTYVNCGQESALVRRIGGDVEQLAPTAPVLGLHEDSRFDERTVRLTPGDAVAVFTDGLTEVGRTRREMLGVAGVASLLENLPPPEPADSAEAAANYLARGLIAGVDAAAQNGVVRDDVCLLLAVVENGADIAAAGVRQGECDT